jgi:hypothetical protein
MKKIYTLVAALMVTIGSWAYEFPGFEWTVGADVTTTYLWRGLNLGGLALQPDVMIGYGGLKLEGWANISPKDYTFKEFNPELDVTLSYSIYGLTVGATHYYYFDGTRYFDYRTPSLADYQAGNYATNQTEVFAKFELGELVEKVPLNILWATTVGGDDWMELYEDDSDPDKLTGIKRAYSSYLEVSFDANLPLGFTLTPAVGMTPWSGQYTFYEDRGFSVNNVSLKLNWELELGDHFALDVYAMGMINTVGIDKTNLIPEIKDSYNNQRLNGCIGAGIWFY